MPSLVRFQAGAGSRVPNADLFFAFAVDNFTFGGSGFDAVVTPEPATLTLTLLGMCAIRLFRGRRWSRRNAADVAQP